MGCPGTEGQGWWIPSSLHLPLFPVCPVLLLEWAVTFAWALAQSERLLGSVYLHPSLSQGRAGQAHRGFENPPWVTTFPREGGVRTPDGSLLTH